MPAQRGRGVAAVGVSGSIIYLAGGVTDGLSDNMLPTGRRQADAYAYDTARDQWETLAPLPEAVGYTMGAVIDKRFYVMGGSTNLARTPNTYVYDPANRAWTAIEPLPRDVSSAGVAVMRGRIVIVGGIASSVGEISPDTQVFDPAKGLWSTVAPMTTPRFAMGAAVLNDRLYVPAGVGETNTAAMFSSIPALEVFIP
jgi:N-acetylneuraminic acid mutarotase